MKERFYKKFLPDFIATRLDNLGYRQTAQKQALEKLKRNRQKTYDKLARKVSDKDELGKRIADTNVTYEPKILDLETGLLETNKRLYADRFPEEQEYVKHGVRDKIDKIVETEEKKDREAEDEGIKDRKWAIERLIEMNILANVKKIEDKQDIERVYKKQIGSLTPWIEYLKAENCSNTFKAYVLINILNLTENDNGDWVLRKNSLGEFPEFDLQTVNRVLAEMEETLFDDLNRESDEEILSGLVGEYSIEEVEEIEDILRNTTLRDAERFAKLYKLLDTITKPKEYKNLSENYKLKKFSVPEGKYDDLPNSEKKIWDNVVAEVAQICKHSLSFCIRGKARAHQYLQEGDLYLLTRTGENIKTEEIDEVPDLAIHIVYRSHRGIMKKDLLKEIRGNEEFQDIHPRNVAVLEELSEKKEGEEDYIPGLREWFRKKETQKRLRNVILQKEFCDKIEKFIKGQGDDLNSQDLKWYKQNPAKLTTFCLHEKTVPVAHEMMKARIEYIREKTGKRLHEITAEDQLKSRE